MQPSLDSIHKDSSTRIKDASIAIRHSRGYIISILQGPERGWRGWTPWLTLTKRKLSIGKRYFCVIENHIEDVKQEEKDVPDLEESITRPTDPVK